MHQQVPTNAPISTHKYTNKYPQMHQYVPTNTPIRTHKYTNKYPQIRFIYTIRHSNIFQPLKGYSTRIIESWYLLYKGLGGPQGRCGWVRGISEPPGFNPRTVPPVVQTTLSRRTKSVNKSVILKRILKEYGVRLWNVIFCHTLGIKSRLL
jgi:hypothetical protein